MHNNNKLRWTEHAQKCVKVVCVYRSCSHITLRSKVDNDPAAISGWTNSVSHLQADWFHDISGHYRNTYMSLG